MKPQLQAPSSKLQHRNLKIALVADWLTNMGGAERLLLALHDAFPDAPVYTSVFDAQACPEFAGLDVRTTYLQKLPRKLRYKHQLWPVVRANAFRKLDLTEYDVVISSASAEAKAVNVREGAKHICYCHTPVRYYWSHYQQYLDDPGFGRLNPVVRLIMPPFVSWMRALDLASVKGVDTFIANSHEVQSRIKQYYHRGSTVIFPPVDTKSMKPKTNQKKEDYYVVVGRQIPYKRIDLAIRACNALKKNLIVIGNGSEHRKLRKIAGSTIKFLTNVSDQQKVAYLQHAKGFIFPSFEDFGIAPVEAMAAGTPVIAYKEGGALDYVVEGTTGLFFDRQTEASLAEAMSAFEKVQFDSDTIIKHAEKFSEERFIKEIQKIVSKTG